MNWCIIVTTKHVSRLGARSRSTSSCFITGSGGIPDWEIARPWHLPSSRRREAALHGVHS